MCEDKGGSSSSSISYNPSPTTTVAHALAGGAQRLFGEDGSRLQTSAAISTVWAVNEPAVRAQLPQEAVARWHGRCGIMAWRGGRWGGV